MGKSLFPLVLLLLAGGCATGGKEAPPRAKASLATLISDDDYPAAALRGDEQGVTTVRLDVSPEGRVTRCTVIGSSGSNSLDAATCRILTARARFHPALDRKGRPVAGSTNARIFWRIAD